MREEECTIRGVKQNEKKTLTIPRLDGKAVDWKNRSTANLTRQHGWQVICATYFYHLGAGKVCFNKRCLPVKFLNS